MGFAVFVGWEYIPGTYYCDDHGFPHGTGKKKYFYDAGSIKLKEYYFAGDLKKSIWYRPDGAVIAITEWKDGAGTGYYLRQDGSIYGKMQFVDDIAHGTAVQYLPDGNIKKKVEYYKGQPVEP